MVSNFLTDRGKVSYLYDLEEEIHHLIGMQRSCARLMDEIDWPTQSLDLFINVVHQNNGTLSKTLTR
jgi:hypothetical protein